jgi:hypothetical protein
MLRTQVLLVGAIVTLAAASAPAQDAVLGQLYGSGVHAYFSGDFGKAYDQLTAAATAGSRDPRVYYFRGLTYLKLGRGPEATQDFQQGAQLESKDLHRTFNVARSLERVQGPARQQLETYRVEARMAALAEADRIRKTRFEAIQKEEQRVLQNQAAQAPAEPIAAPDGQPGAKAPQTDVFGNAADENKAAPAADAKDMGDNAEKPVEPGALGGGDEKPAAEAKASPFVEEPAADAKAAPPVVEKMDSEKPAVEKKSGPVKQSILGALIKGSESGIKKSLGRSAGGLGNMVPGGIGPGGPGSGPGGPMTPSAPAPGPGFGDFGSPTGEQAAPPQKAPEKPADKPATEKPGDEKDPFDT